MVATAALALVAGLTATPARADVCVPITGPPTPKSICASSITGPVVDLVFQAVAIAEAEAAQAQQIANGAVATATALANSAIGTVLTTVGTAEQEAFCVEGQALNPNPSGTTDTVCRTVGTESQTAQALAGSAVGTVQTLAGQVQSDATCVAGQVSNPDPTRGDAVCQAAGGAVKAVGNAVSPTPGMYSNTCTSPGAAIADGYADGTYVTLREQQNPNDPSTAWICYRISRPSTAEVGGRLDVTSPATAVGQAGVDDNSGACAANSATNTLPGPHPLLAGTLVGQDFSVDAYSASGSAWACLLVGSVGKRVVVPVPGVTAPAVVNHSDSPPPALPAPTPDAYPSGACQAALTGNTQVANFDVDGAHAWAYTWQPDATTVKVCVRVQGAGASAGGVLSVSATGSPGVGPSVSTSSTDMTPCGTTVLALTSPVATFLKTSSVQPTTNPVSVCIGAGSQQERVSVGTSGTLVPPSVTWTPDPGTP